MTRHDCPRCGRSFDTLVGLDAHRRNAAPCRYGRDEPRATWRPGLLATPGRQVRPGW